MDKAAPCDGEVRGGDGTGVFVVEGEGMAEEKVVEVRSEEEEEEEEEGGDKTT